jgi:hypothetical protein
MSIFKTLVGLLTIAANINEADARSGEATGLHQPPSENNNQDQPACLTGAFKEEEAQIELQSWNFTHVSCLTGLHSSLSTQPDIDACKEATIDSKVNCGGDDINLKVNKAGLELLTQGKTPSPTPSPSSSPTPSPTHKGDTNTPTKAPTPPPTYPAALPEPLPVNAIVAGTNAGAAMMLVVGAAARSYNWQPGRAVIITNAIAAVLQCSPMLVVHNDPTDTVQNPLPNEKALAQAAGDSVKADISYSIAQASLLLAHTVKPSDIVTALIIEANLANMIDNSVRAASGPHSRAEEANIGSSTRAGSLFILVAVFKKIYDTYNRNADGDDLKNRLMKEYGPTVVALLLTLTTISLQASATDKVSGVHCNATSAGSGSGYNPINCDHGRENNGHQLDPNGTTGVLIGSTVFAGLTCAATKIWECWATQKQKLIERFNTAFNNAGDKLDALRALINDDRLNGVDDTNLPNIDELNQRLENIRQDFEQLEDNNITATTVNSMINTNIQSLRNDIRRASNNVRQVISSLRLPAPGNTPPQNPLLESGSHLQNHLLGSGS